LDLIVINSVHGEFYVIDHGNTFTKGDAAGSIALAALSKEIFYIVLVTLQNITRVTRHQF